MKELNESLGVIKGYVESGANFVIEQAPLYVQELLVYHTIINYIALGILITTTLICTGLYIKFYLHYRKDPNNDDLVACVIVTLVTGIVFLFTCLVPTINLVKIKTAPRVFVLDKIKEKL